MKKFKLIKSEENYREFLFKSGNTIILKQGEIEKEVGDVIMVWTALGLKSGSNSFYKISIEGGSQFQSSKDPFLYKIKEGDAFSTIAGLLKFYIAIHVIMSETNLNKREEDGVINLSVLNLITTLKQFKKKNICRNIYIPFEFERKSFLKHLIQYENELEDFKFILMVDSKTQFDSANILFINA